MAVGLPCAQGILCSLPGDLTVSDNAGPAIVVIARWKQEGFCLPDFGIGDLLIPKAGQEFT